jgi:hypothetical protein
LMRPPKPSTRTSSPGAAIEGSILESEGQSMTGVVSGEPENGPGVGVGVASGAVAAAPPQAKSDRAVASAGRSFTKSVPLKVLLAQAKPASHDLAGYSTFRLVACP